MSNAISPSTFGPNEIITLTREGVFLSNGEEITHPGTLKAFSRSLFRTPTGFEIRIGPEKKEIQIEDTLYFVTSVEGNSDQGFTLQLNDGRKLPLNAETLKYLPSRLTCKVEHPNENTQEEAKFLTSPYYEILKLLEESRGGFEVRIQGKTFQLGDKPTK